MDRPVTAFAAIPVKGLSTSKSRLSASLDAEKKVRLITTMLNDVVRAVLTAKRVTRVVVVSPDRGALRLAVELGAEAVVEGEAGLNSAVDQVTRWCMGKGADSVLVLPADIPLVTADDIDLIVAMGSEPRSVVLAPSADGGTNALLRRPPDLIPPCFGPDSFERHLCAARARGVEAKVCTSPGLSMDIDSEDDLRRLLALPVRTLTQRLLNEMGKG
jgi:2-phospho-L-lactate guanylyltransferase